MLPSGIPKLPTDPPVSHSEYLYVCTCAHVHVCMIGWECFLVFGNFSFKTPFLGWISIPTSSFFLFIFYILSYLLLKTKGCLSGCLMSSASIQKLFCGICSVFKCSFNELVGEKVVSLSYSSAILGPPLCFAFLIFLFHLFKILFSHFRISHSFHS